MDRRAVRVELIGDCEPLEAVNAAVSAGGLEGVVTVSGQIDHAQALARMVNADVLLLLAQGQPYQIPAKLYEYLHAQSVRAGVHRRRLRPGHRRDRRRARRGAGPGRSPGASRIADLHRSGQLARWVVPPEKLAPYQARHLAGLLAGRLDGLVGGNGISAGRPPPGRQLKRGPVPQTSRPAKVSVLFGTRPEAIKLAPVILALRDEPEIACHVCDTAQHRQMVDQVLDAFGLVPDADLDLMRPGQTLAGLTARSVEAIDAYLAAERPDLVLVQGDTTTVLSASLAAFYRKIPIGHVEAGLRTGDLSAPWPEEANRVLTSRLAALAFRPDRREPEEPAGGGGARFEDLRHGQHGHRRPLHGPGEGPARPPTIPGLPSALTAGGRLERPWC